MRWTTPGRPRPTNPTSCPSRAGSSSSISVNAHPADVITPWQRLIEQRLGMTNDKYRYGRAIKMLRLLCGAYRATDHEAGFDTYLGDLRDRHRRKTSFLAQLDRTAL